MDDRASARLAALARHIGAATNGERVRRGGRATPACFVFGACLTPPPRLSGALVPVPTAASTARPVPGGGPGTLTLVDSRTGKRYDVPIREGGVIRATDLKQIVAGGDGMGLRTYDPG